MNKTPLRVSLVQGETRWQDAAANRAYYGDLVRRLRGQSDLIVLPETFLSGFTNETLGNAEGMDGEGVRWQCALAVEVVRFEPWIVGPESGRPDHGRHIPKGERGVRSRYDGWARSIGRGQLAVEPIRGCEGVDAVEKPSQLEVGRGALVVERAGELRVGTGDAGQPSDELNPCAME